MAPFRLNGWQRVAIVLSVVWAIVGSLWALNLLFARLPKLRNLPTSKQRQCLGLSETVRDAVGDGSTAAIDRSSHCCSRSHSCRVAARLRADRDSAMDTPRLPAVEPI